MQVKSKKNGIKLIIGGTTSAIGNSLFDYVNTIFLTKIPNSVFFVGIYQNIEVILNFIFSPIGGYCGDKYKRKYILVATELLSSLFCLFGLFFIRTNTFLMYILIANGILSILTCFYDPAIRAYPNEIISKSDLDIYNSKKSAFQEIARVISPLLGVLLLKRIDISIFYLINSISFIISAYLEYSTTPIGDSIIKLRQASEERDKKRKYNFKKILIYIYNNKALLEVIILSFFSNFFFSGYNLLLPFINVKGNNPYGLLLTFESIGSICAGLIFKKFSKINTSGCIKMCGISMILISANKVNEYYLSLFILCLSTFTLGFFLSMFNIKFIVFVQKNTNQSIMSRVWGYIGSIASLLMPLGTLTFSLVFRATNIGTSFLVTGIGLILVTYMANYFVKI